MIKRLAVLALCLAATTAFAQTDEEKSRATEVWTPAPPVVTVDARGIPSDAIILYRGAYLDSWESVKGGAAPWVSNNHEMSVVPGTGDIRTKESFCDVQLHVEWQVPKNVIDAKGVEMTGQNRNNSGIFLQERYEVQVLDSYKSQTYANGQAGAIYKQSIPLANASKAPGEWQTYDIFYSAPKFDAAGKLAAPAIVTVLYNGVLVQNHFEIQGPTAWIGHPAYEAHGCAPIRLQDHGHPVRYRNIWVRKL